MNGQAATHQASEVLPTLRADDQRRDHLQVVPTLVECETVIEDQRKASPRSEAGDRRMTSERHSAAAFERVGLTVPRVLDHAVQVRPCACGGTVRADVRFPVDGVSRHNRSKAHEAWRAARENA